MRSKERILFLFAFYRTLFPFLWSVTVPYVFRFRLVSLWHRSVPVPFAFSYPFCTHFMPVRKWLQTLPVCDCFTKRYAKFVQRQQLVHSYVIPKTFKSCQCFGLVPFSCPCFFSNVLFYIFRIEHTKRIKTFCLHWIKSKWYFFSDTGRNLQVWLLLCGITPTVEEDWHTKHALEVCLKPQ